MILCACGKSVFQALTDFETIIEDDDVFLDQSYLLLFTIVMQGYCRKQEIKKNKHLIGWAEATLSTDLFDFSMRTVTDF